MGLRGVGGAVNCQLGGAKLAEHVARVGTYIAKGVTLNLLSKAFVEEGAAESEKVGKQTAPLSARIRHAEKQNARQRARHMGW